MQVYFLLFVSLALCPALAFAQISAVLSGDVTDPSGLAITSAAIMAVNADTGLTRITSTDGAGRYRFFALPIGEYAVHAKKAGFAEEIRTGIHLVVGQEASVDLRLRIGEVDQQITVNQDAPAVALT